MNNLLIILTFVGMLSSCTISNENGGDASPTTQNRSAKSVINTTALSRSVAKMKSSSVQLDLIDLEEKADVVVDYDAFSQSDNITIRGTNKFDQNLTNLVIFFDQQVKKDLVVVIISKHCLTEAEISQKVSMLKLYFVERGYHRVNIQQATGFGSVLHLDYIKSTR